MTWYYSFILIRIRQSLLEWISIPRIRHRISSLLQSQQSYGLSSKLLVSLWCQLTGDSMLSRMWVRSFYLKWEYIFKFVWFVAGDPCTLPQAIGSGPASLPRWYFNTAARQCQQFTYTGIAGNQNNFLTQRDCQQTCPGELLLAVNLL